MPSGIPLQPQESVFHIGGGNITKNTDTVVRSLSSFLFAYFSFLRTMECFESVSRVKDSSDKRKRIKIDDLVAAIDQEIDYQRDS